ncbi:MAG: CHASE3 domain-containing protein [Rugosibacter sp.]|nr:CHASE3 domain-containing protein [Rugosibacter sp.]
MSISETSKESAIPVYTLRHTWLAIATLVLVISIVATTTWKSQTSLAEMHAVTDARAQARSGRLQLEHVLSLFKDIETGSRGFVLTGEDSYLDPYRQGIKVLPDEYARLKRLLAPSLPPGFTWEQLDTQVKLRLERADAIIAATRLKGKTIIGETTPFAAGKKSMDQIRQRFNMLDIHQVQQIATLNTHVLDLRRRTRIFSLLTTGAAIFLVIVTAALLLRERYLRRKLEAFLRQSNQTLEARVIERTIELTTAHNLLTDFATEQERAIEAERYRLAREVHDQIGQIFTTIKLICHSTPNNSLPPDQQAALDQAIDLGLASARRITAELRPPLLDDLGLAAALHHFSAEYSRHSKLSCVINIQNHQKLSAPQALALFRITQEATTNILRHAGATEVQIAGSASNDNYLLSISDNGRGIDLDNIRPGAIGLISMRERTMLINGTFRIFPQKNSGTCIEVRLPLIKNTS